MTWQERLKALQDDIWQDHHNPGAHRAYQNWSSERRRLTPEEWDEVRAIIREHKPICHPHNACMGFSIGMALFEEPPRIFPGAVLRPEFLIDITTKHLPLTLCELRQPGDKGYGEGYNDRLFFDDGWRTFSPFTHTEENGKRLVENGFESLQSKGHYDY